MRRPLTILVLSLFLSGSAFGDQNDRGYMPRQQQQRQYEQQQPAQQQQFQRRDDYRDDYNQSEGNQGYQGYQGYQGGYRGYNQQPPTGYQAPADYYGLPPVRGFVYPQQQQQQPQQKPRIERRQRERW